MYVCMYVFIYVRLYVCMYICVYVRTCDFVWQVFRWMGAYVDGWKDGLVSWWLASFADR